MMKRKGTDRKFVVYSLLLNEDIIYIGKTSVSLSQRLHAHITINKRIIKKYPNDLNDIKISAIEECLNNNDAIEREKFWINYYKTKVNLINKFHCSNRIIPKKHLMGFENTAA